jgi:predicted acylesterase/phospholipase RssA
VSGRRLDPGDLPREERRGRQDRHLLALGGGGYRGLFSAEILAAAEAEGGASLSERFDMIVGTSIGGILAIAIGCGIAARDLVALMREHGPAIFRPKPLSLAGFSRSRYGGENLGRAIEAILGRQLARRPFAEIPIPLAVCAIDERTGAPHVFRSGMAAAGGKGDQVPTLDVALATSAAPTYFPPHRIGDRVYVDGGLVANAPDLVVLTEAMRRFGCSLDECHLLSIGTGGAPRAGTVEGSPGKLGWLARHAIIDLIMKAQETLATDQVWCLHPGTYLRIDAVPASPIRLDDTSARATEQLLGLVRQALLDVKGANVRDWRRFLAHSPSAAAKTVR